MSFKRCGASKWYPTSFITPKQNDTVKFLTEVTQDNERIVRNYFHHQKIKVFQFASALNLNMRYYTVRIDSQTRDMCAVILSLGIYNYIKLQRGCHFLLIFFKDKM